MRGSANGSRIRLPPKKDWPANDSDKLSRVLARLEAVQKDFNDSLPGGKKVSLVDVIILGGAAAIEQAARKAGHDIEVPFQPGRMDASQAQTDVCCFGYLEPTADGFRNYYSDESARSPAEMLVEKAELPTLTVPEMTGTGGWHAQPGRQ